jgi:MtN3 and saliva related transmembrane protein
MQFINGLGFVAGAVTTLSFLPQVHKAWRTKRCDDLSLAMLLALALGSSLWLGYGLILRAAPIVAANAVTLALVLMLISFKTRYRGDKKAAS